MSEFEKIEDVLACDIEDFFQDNVINKSQKYLLGQRITDYQYNDGKMVQAFVKGGYNYFVTLSVFDGEFFSTCTCSENGKCEHIAALFQYAKNKLVISNVISSKSFEDECLEFYKKFKVDVNNRNVITQETYSLFDEAIEKHINILSKLNDDEYLNYYIKLIYSIEKYNTNSYYSEYFSKLYSKFFNINYELLMSNALLLIRKLKEIQNIIKLDIACNVIRGYINNLNNVTKINFQNNKNAKELINYVLTDNMLGIFNDTIKEELNKYLDVLNYYDGIDESIYHIEQNLNDLNYLYAYSSILFADGKYEEIIELYNEYGKKESVSFRYLLNVIEAGIKIDNIEFSKEIILNIIPHIINEKEELSLLISKNKVLFDNLFRAEFLINVRKNNKPLIDKIYNINERYKLYSLELNALDREFEFYNEDFKYDYLMNYHYHISKMIENVSQYDYSAGRKIIVYLNKMERIPLGKYYLHDLYDYARILKKENLASDIIRNIRYINY